MLKNNFQELKERLSHKVETQATNVQLYLKLMLKKLIVIARLF